MKRKVTALMFVLSMALAAPLFARGHGRVVGSRGSHERHIGTGSHGHGGSHRSFKGRHTRDHKSIHGHKQRSHASKSSVKHRTGKAKDHRRSPHPTRHHTIYKHHNGHHPAHHHTVYKHSNPHYRGNVVVDTHGGYYDPSVCSGWPGGCGFGVATAIAATTAASDNDNDYDYDDINDNNDD